MGESGSARARISVDGARAIASVVKEWTEYRFSGGKTTDVGNEKPRGQDLHFVATAADSDGTNHWIYTGNLFDGPGLGNPVAEDALAFNNIEVGNNGTAASGYTIGTDGVTGVRPAPLGKPFRVTGPYLEGDQWAYRFEWPNIPDVECE
jgi:hypothetical protein